MTANQAQATAWNGESGTRWVADADRRDAVLQPIADALLDAAAITPGERVLDVGCGCGATTIAAALTPADAFGVDLSAPMLGVARRRAAGTRATFVEADAQTQPMGDAAFEVVISRFGTMFFDDPRAAFNNIAAATRSGGRLCLATWQALDANPWLLVPGAALLQFGSLPDMPNDEPGMFAQADPDTVAAILEIAGWHGIDIEPRTIRLRLGADPADATDYLADTGIARRVLDTIPDHRRPAALDAVTSTLADHAGPDGVQLDAGINFIHARR